MRLQIEYIKYTNQKERLSVSINGVDILRGDGLYSALMLEYNGTLKDVEADGLINLKDLCFNNDIKITFVDGTSFKMPISVICPFSEKHDIDTIIDSIVSFLKELKESIEKEIKNSKPKTIIIDTLL
jgi:hypothetical protein